MCAASVSSVRKNFRRAGRLKKSCRTSTLVPGALPAALTSAIFPPLTTICVPSGELPVAFARGQGEPADTGDAGQRLAAKTHRGDGRQILGALDFAGRVAFEAEQRIVAAHAGAVVGHADETASAGLDFDGDARAPARRARFRPAPSRRWRGVRPLRRRRFDWRRVRAADGCGSWAVKREG